MKHTIALFVLVGLSFLSCKKQPGEGGFASIEGKIYMKDYDDSYTIVTAEYYAPGETVYIIYGDGTEVGNTVKTSYDGSFKFNYLRKGKYKVYALTEDTTQPYLAVPKEVLMEVTITKKKEKVVLDDFVLAK
ncbi:MAG: hypothetical protein V4677_11070 [Bacteroidota bacterium]